ncbi:MAG: potassium channel protein [Salegentibacter sp.]
MRYLFKSRVRAAIILVILVILTGILGFRFISGYSWVDAVFMTVITISTVGYGEVHPLGIFGKVFTSFFIVSGIIIIGFGFSVITEYILSKNDIGNLKRKKMEKEIAALKDHIIVCGYGQNGKQAVQKLLAYRKKFVVIEIKEESLANLQESDILFIEGNATEDEVLQRAGIQRASTVISTLPSDADNLFIVLSARQINEQLRIISRATEENSYRKLKFAGADNVIMPDRIGGNHMASLVVSPDLVDFLDNLSGAGELESINVQQVPFEKICSDNEEKTISQIDIRKNTGCSIIGYITPSGSYVVNPEPDLRLERESKLILLGRSDQIESLKKQYSV